MRTERRFTLGRWGGYHGHFWLGDAKFLAFNEGGNGPFTFNLKLWKGWLLVGFYFSFRAFGRWFRVHPGWRF